MFSRTRGFRAYVGLQIIILSLAAVCAFAQSQSQCSTTTTQRWAKGTTVYYSLGNLDPTQSQQVQNAIKQWQDVSDAQGLGITFQPSSTMPAGTQNPATLNFTNSTQYNAPGHMDPSRVRLSDQAIFTANISFNTSARFGQDGRAIFDNNDPAAATALYFKIALHEIAHTMGLDEAPVPQTGYCDQGKGVTIMNGVCGPNDSGGNLPDHITDCDKSNVKDIYSGKPPTSPNARPHDIGGADGGDACGSDPCCGDPCCGDPCCGDPCCGDPCCGDPCCGDPNCGLHCYDDCWQDCYETCGVEDVETGECLYWEWTCDPPVCQTNCY